MFDCMDWMNDRLFPLIDIHPSLTGTELANKTTKTDGKSYNDLKLVESADGNRIGAVTTVIWSNRG